MTDSKKWLLFGTLGVAAVLIYLLRPILAPFLVGALLAYLGDPLADRLEDKGLSRTTSVVIVFVVLSTLFGLLLLLLIPLLGKQIASLGVQLTEWLHWGQDKALPWIQQQLGMDKQNTFDLEKIKTTIANNWQQTGNILTQIITTVSKSGLAFFGFLANLVLIPVVAFYLLRDWDVLIQKIADLLPRDLEPIISKLAKECDEVLSAFLRGQLSIMFILGCIYSIGLWIVGLKLALIIGMLAGLASIVPYMGFIVGIVAAFAAAFSQFGDIGSLIGVCIVFGIGQTLEGMVLTPLLVGDRIGLHPVAVIFAILAGGQLFGFVGVLLALPVAAVIMVVLQHLHNNYTSSPLYQGQGGGDSGDSSPNNDNVDQQASVGNNELSENITGMDKPANVSEDGA